MIYFLLFVTSPKQNPCSFRDRNRALEIGPPSGYISGSTYVPRAAYKGGGLLNRPGSAAVAESLERATAAAAVRNGRADFRDFVSGLEPRSCTCAVSEVVRAW